MNQLSQERIAPHPANRLLFREVNDRLRDLAETFGPNGDSIDLVCECGRPDCFERLTLDREAYEQLRNTPGLFALRPGHLGTADMIVQRLGTYDVVSAERFLEEL